MLAWVRFGAGGLGAAVLIVLLGPARAMNFPFVSRAPVWVHRCFAFALGLRVDAAGTGTTGARLIVANHVSWLDIVALGALEPFVFVAKSEVGGSPLARALLSLQGVVLVDRRRRRILPGVVVEMAKHLAQGRSVVLFAEATTGDGTRLLPLKTSLFEAAVAAGSSVQAAFLDYPSRGGIATTRRERAEIAWIGDAAFAPHLIEVLRMGGVRCRIAFSSPKAVAGRPRKRLAGAADRALRTLRAGRRV